MRRLFPVTLLAFGLLVALAGAQSIPSSDAVLASATKEAAKGKKTVMVIFHASWCGWCKRLDAFLAQPDVKPVIDRYLVVTHLTVLESPNKKAEENPGGNEYLEKAGGKEAGLPFTILLDSKGKQVAASWLPSEASKPAQNIGYPASDAEIDAFMAMLKKGAKQIPAADLALLKFKFQEAAKKIK